MFENLYKICKSGDYKELKKILKTYYFDSDDSISSEDQKSLTEIAAENGHSKVLELLLLNECSCDGEALLLALYHDHLDCFKLIIRQYKFEFSEENLNDIEYHLKKLPEDRREKYYYELIHKNKMLPRKLLKSNNWWYYLKNHNYCIEEEDVQYVNMLRYDYLEKKDGLKYFPLLDKNYIEVSKLFEIQQEAINVCTEGNLEIFKYLKETWKLPIIEEYLQAACRSKNLKLVEFITSFYDFKFKLKNINTNDPVIKAYLKKRQVELFSLFGKYESESENESESESESDNESDNEC